MVICEVRIAKVQKVICEMACKKLYEKSVKCERYVYVKSAFELRWAASTAAAHSLAVMGN